MAQELPRLHERLEELQEHRAHLPAPRPLLHPKEALKLGAPEVPPLLAERPTPLPQRQPLLLLGARPLVRLLLERAEQFLQARLLLQEAEPPAEVADKLLKNAVKKK